MSPTLKYLERGEGKPIYVTEFKNQFDEWQLMHATRNRTKAFEDAGRSGRVIECCEMLPNSPDAATLSAMVRGLYEAMERLRDDKWIGNTPMKYGDDNARGFITKALESCDALAAKKMEERG